MNGADLSGLSAIRPTNVVDYLRNHGWVETSGNYEVVTYGRDSERGPVKAKVLLDDSFSDFAVRMAEVAETISLLEKRPLDWFQLLPRWVRYPSGKTSEGAQLRPFFLLWKWRSGQPGIPMC